MDTLIFLLFCVGWILRSYNHHSLSTNPKKCKLPRRQTTESRYLNTKCGRFDCASLNEWVETVLIPYMRRKQGQNERIFNVLVTPITVDVVLKHNE